MSPDNRARRISEEIYSRNAFWKLEHMRFPRLNKASSVLSNGHWLPEGELHANYLDYRRG
jgi:hypothetical protein